MLEFPYMTLPGGITRPMIGVVIEGAAGRRLLDGLVDTGSDRAIFPKREAQSIGIQLRSTPDGQFRTAGGVSIAYWLANAVLELRAGNSVVRWRASVAFADGRLQIIHLGYRGFLEYFHCTFLGPEKKLVLDPQPGLPIA